MIKNNINYCLLGLNSGHYRHVGGVIYTYYGAMSGAADTFRNNCQCAMNQDAPLQRRTPLTPFPSGV